MEIPTIISEDKHRFSINGLINAKYLHSFGYLDQDEYRYLGTIEVKEIQTEDLIVSIDAVAYLVRHKKTNEIIFLRNGTYADPIGKIRSLKLVGVIRKSETSNNKYLFLLIENAPTKLSDISDKLPMRAAGRVAAKRKIDSALLN